MTRLFGIAGVQMSVVPWDANATVDKMADIVKNVHKSFPWVQLVMFHELAVPGLVSFVTTNNGDTWKKNAEPIAAMMEKATAAGTAAAAAAAQASKK